MRRYLRVYKKFFLTSIAREMEFRANFFAKIAQNLVWVGFAILVLLVIYRNTDAIAGWGKGDATILLGTTIFMNALSAMFTMGLMEIPEQVRKGTLDFVVTKPIDSQYWVSLRKFHFEQSGVALSGLAIIIIGVVLSKAHPSLMDIFGYATLTLCAVIIFYSVNLILMTLGIYFVRVENLWVLGDTVISVVRFPLDIYPKALIRFLTFAVPMAFLAYEPSKQLTQGIQISMVGLGIGWALALFLAARVFWHKSLVHYSSASS
ncbi:MAG: ABC-2 family transporter protein [Fimbriimonadaceae bacterium]|nr:ABC-2 family transporter protein [Fimbriimonadaceae bacterium]